MCVGWGCLSVCGACVGCDMVNCACDNYAYVCGLERVLVVIWLEMCVSVVSYTIRV